MAGIYIHIPFCVRKCAYCDFFSSTILARKEQVLNAMHRELEYSKQFGNAQTVNTVYFGGGTPSLLSPRELSGLLEAVRKLYNCDLKEVTIECNPDDLTPEYLQALMGAGFDRLSIGVQSFCDEQLKFMNRRHNALQAVRSIEQARRAGFGNITIDLIYGIPGFPPAQWEQTLEKAIDLAPDHISAYHLTIEPGTALDRLREKGEISPVPDTVSTEQYDTLREKLAAAGYEHYEISNFAQQGRRSRHNSSYWEGTPYIGIGPGAHSYDGDYRRWSPHSLGQYINEAGTGNLYACERLSPEDKINEFIMTSMRTADGLDTKKMERLFGRGQATALLARARYDIDRGFIISTYSGLRIPHDKFLISDNIISGLFV